MNGKDTLKNQLNSYVMRTLESGVKPLGVVFEPIYDCSYGDTAGYRAEVYVNSIIKGTLFPKDYMRSGVSEKILTDISLRAVKKICKIKKTAEKAGVKLKCVFLRCASSLLNEPDLYNLIKSVLYGENSDGEGIYLEFFPEAFEYETEILINAFRDIRAAGLKVAADGYGGKDFPIEKVISVCPDVVFTDTKIAGLSLNREKSPAIAPLINLIKGLGGKVIAENVKSDEELREFRARDCFGFIPSEKYSGSLGAVKKRVDSENLIEEVGGDE